MIKGFGDGFGTHFGSSWIEEVDAVAPGATDTIVYSEIAGAAIARRRRRFVFVSEDAEAPGSEDTIFYTSASGQVVANGIAAGSTSELQTQFVPGRAIGQKVSVVSGRVFGDAIAPGSIAEIGVSAVEGPIGNRLDNDFISTDGEPVVDPVEIDNDLLMAA